MPVAGSSVVRLPDACSLHCGLCFMNDLEPTIAVLILLLQRYVIPSVKVMWNVDHSCGLVRRTL